MLVTWFVVFTLSTLYCLVYFLICISLLVVSCQRCRFSFVFIYYYLHTLSYVNYLDNFVLSAIYFLICPIYNIFSILPSLSFLKRHVYCLSAIVTAMSCLLCLISFISDMKYIISCLHSILSIFYYLIWLLLFCLLSLNCFV